jgi:O-methyltransferase
LERSVIFPWAAYRGWRPLLTPVRAENLRYQFGYDEEDAIKKAARQVCDHTMISFDRLASLWLQVRYLDCNRIPGALVECGVAAGGASAMMALAHMASSSAPKRQLHLFDSFQGLPAPGKYDGPSAADFTGKLAFPRETSERLLRDVVKYDMVLARYHCGWFQETLPRDAESIGPIALLRLDGDWYESTKVCLESLYQQVVPTGIVAIDDYGYWRGCRKAVDEFTARLPQPFMLHRIDDCGRYWVKR